MRNRDHLEEYALDELEQVAGGCNKNHGGGRQFFGGDSTYVSCGQGGNQNNFMEMFLMFQLLGDNKGRRRR